MFMMMIFKKITQYNSQVRLRSIGTIDKHAQFIALL
jgi:hypothetical protein